MIDDSLVCVKDCFEKVKLLLVIDVGEIVLWVLEMFSL